MFALCMVLKCNKDLLTVHELVNQLVLFASFPSLFTEVHKIFAVCIFISMAKTQIQLSPINQISEPFTALTATRSSTVESPNCCYDSILYSLNPQKRKKWCGYTRLHVKPLVGDYLTIQCIQNVHIYHIMLYPVMLLDITFVSDFVVTVKQIYTVIIILIFLTKDD